MNSAPPIKAWQTQTGNRHQRQQRIAQDVTNADGGFGQPFGPRSCYVILAHYLPRRWSVCSAGTRRFPSMPRTVAGSTK